jgi:hypothetical protein
MRFKDLFKKSDKKVIEQKVDSASIEAALLARKEEIESLKAYDRGEKTITPRNLHNAV